MQVRNRAEQWRQMSFVSIVIYEAYCPPPFTAIFQNNSAFFDLFLLLGKHRCQFYVRLISTKESSPFHRYRSIFCFIAWFETTRPFKSDKLRNERSTSESRAICHAHLWILIFKYWYLFPGKSWKSASFFRWKIFHQKSTTSSRRRNNYFGILRRSITLSND